MFAKRPERIQTAGNVAGTGREPSRDLIRSGTRLALVEAGLELFGRKGFDGTSTRELANLAGANVASIGYHFGGKAGLRQACAEHAAEFMRSVAGSGFGGGGGMPESPEAARKMLNAFVRTVVRLIIVEPRAEIIVRFVLREIGNPSDAFAVIFSSVISPTHARVCRIWATATGEDPDSDAVKLGVFAVMGQAIYFRIGKPVVERQMGWSNYGPEEAELIAGEIIGNMNSALDRHRETAAGGAAR